MISYNTKHYFDIDLKKTTKAINKVLKQKEYPKLKFDVDYYTNDNINSVCLIITPKNAEVYKILNDNPSLFRTCMNKLLLNTYMDKIEFCKATSFHKVYFDTYDNMKEVKIIRDNINKESKNIKSFIRFEIFLDIKDDYEINNDIE